MTNSDLKLNFNKNKGNYEIIYKGFSWVSDGRKPYITVRKKVPEVFYFRDLSFAQVIVQGIKYYLISISLTLLFFSCFGTTICKMPSSNFASTPSTLASAK